MSENVLKRMPTVEDVEQQLAKNRREAAFLRALRIALHRLKTQERVSDFFNSKRKCGGQDG